MHAVGESNLEDDQVIYAFPLPPPLLPPPLSLFLSLSSSVFCFFPCSSNSATLSQSVLFPPDHRQLSLSPSVPTYLSVRLRRRTLPLQTSSGMLLVGRAKRVPASRSPFIPVTRSRSRERRRATNYKLHVLAVYLHDRWQYCALFVSADQMPACTNVPVLRRRSRLFFLLAPSTLALRPLLVPESVRVVSLFLLLLLVPPPLLLLQLLPSRTKSSRGS